MGWFYGFKVHIVMNQFGEIVSSGLSNGHVADIKMVEQLAECLQGLCCTNLSVKGFSAI